MAARAHPSRRAFIASQGATCKNWAWNWSFVNHEKREVIFGAWDKHTQGEIEMIFTEDWQRLNTRSANGYKESLQHLRLVEQSGYKLKTFQMQWSGKNKRPDGKGPSAIKSFTPRLQEKQLVKIGRNWYATSRSSHPGFAEELTDGEIYPEGAKTTVTVNAYERNPAAREACIRHHGCKCAVCNFDFAQVYGPLGDGFIHVHHISPVSLSTEPWNINPKTDLIPVCPNCHAMLHQTRVPLSVADLRMLLAQTRKKSNSSFPTAQLHPSHS